MDALDGLYCDTLGANGSAFAYFPLTYYLLRLCGIANIYVGDGARSQPMRAVLRLALPETFGNGWN